MVWYHTTIPVMIVAWYVWWYGTTTYHYSVYRRSNARIFIKIKIGDERVNTLGHFASEIVYGLVTAIATLRQNQSPSETYCRRASCAIDWSLPLPRQITRVHTHLTKNTRTAVSVIHPVVEHYGRVSLRQLQRVQVCYQPRRDVVDDGNITQHSPD